MQAGSLPAYLVREQFLGVHFDARECQADARSPIDPSAARLLRRAPAVNGPPPQVAHSLASLLQWVRLPASLLPSRRREKQPRHGRWLPVTAAVARQALLLRAEHRQCCL